MVVIKWINVLQPTPSVPIWQRNYYEHIIRNQVALHKTREYVQIDPQSWNCDQLHPDSPSKW
ncbi:hypothetical protein [uncultured Nostoc sp.]|uniref:hypothetical protein n=1 Tax=uncultured Nostoc sp. TaxID=340711 RepID=UPI002629E111|nr:hypothetical protein [uncultured Nostoc sp.]